MLGEEIESFEFNNQRLNQFVELAKKSSVPTKFLQDLRAVSKTTMDQSTMLPDYQKNAELMFGGERFGSPTIARYAIFYARAVATAKLYDYSLRNPNKLGTAEHLKKEIVREVSPVLNTEYKAANTSDAAHEFEQMVNVQMGKQQEAKFTLEDLKSARDKVEEYFKNQTPQEKQS